MDPFVTMTTTFPPPIGELLQDFADVPDWDERYEYIVELGRQLPPIDPALQTAANRVHGCMSTVWMVAEAIGDGEPQLKITADSDSLIVKGLIVILLSLFSGQRLADIATADVDSVFQQLGLAQHLSPNRRNGLYSMVKRIKALAIENLSYGGKN